MILLRQPASSEALWRVRKAPWRTGGASPLADPLHRYKPHEHWVLPVTKAVTTGKREGLQKGIISPMEGEGYT